MSWLCIQHYLLKHDHTYWKKGEKIYLKFKKKEKNLMLLLDRVFVQWIARELRNIQDSENFLAIVKNSKWIYLKSKFCSILKYYKT